MSSLPEFPKFDTALQPTSLGICWEKWMKRLENLFVALEITDEPRQRALLLHYAGEEVNDIYETLTDTTKSYASTKGALDEYFKPKKNLTFEVYNFRQLKQNDEGKKSQNSDETIDQYLSRLKEAGLRCEFNDLDREDQIVFSCKSDMLRRKGLQDDPSVDNLLKYARSIESSELQAKIIAPDNQSDVYKITKPGKYSARKNLRQEPPDKRKTCYRCGKAWPHSEDGAQCTGKRQKTTSCFNCGRSWSHIGGNSACPAKGKICTICNKRNHFSTVCPNNRKYAAQIIQDDKDSDHSSGDSYCYRVKAASLRKINTGVNVKIKNRNIFMKIDTGSDVNIIDEDVYKKIKGYVTLEKPKIKLLGYNSNTPLRTIGKFCETVEVRKQNRSNILRRFRT